MGDYDNTFFLFADPSFLRGAASAFDLGGSLVQFNQSLTPELANARALASDWAAVGGDLREAIKAITEEVPDIDAATTE